MLVKNNKDLDFPEITKITYRLVSGKFGHSARITDIWQLLKTAFDIDEFEMLDIRNYQHVSEFESYLIDQQINWVNGRDVNFTDIYEAILTAGDFTKLEKLQFSDGMMEERLWGILLAIVNPNMNL